MEVHFALPEMLEIDRLKCDAIGVPFFSDERPPRGVLGLLDWRMCGLVSRMMMRGKIVGAPLETVMVPARQRLSVDKLLLFGAGPRASQSLILGAKARAVLHGRFAASIEDVIALARPILVHRVLVNFRAEAGGKTSRDVIEAVIHKIKRG